MKATKSPEEALVTPNKKKLKQARLPFKILSDVSPKPVTPLTRKRKLSVTNVEPTPKVGKVCNENELIEESVVISDDDSEDVIQSDKDIKLPNPYVKLVDTARKKKLQKSKKKKNAKKRTPEIDNVSNNHQTTNENTESELMDVDVVPENEENKSTEKTETSTSTTLCTNKINNSEIVVLEDSNNSHGIDDCAQNNIISDSPKKKENKNIEVVEQSQSINKKSPKKNKESELHDTENKITPKRSMRSRTKEHNNSKETLSLKLNDSIGSRPSPDSKHNDSICSATSTPKSTKNLSSANSQENVSLNESTISATLTPKQIQKKLEFAKKKEERERKRQQEKEDRAKLRQEKEEQKKREREEKEEARKKEKEEKEEQKRKEKEEKERQKELEKKQREEKEEQRRKEKEEKEEQKRKEREAKEEEKKKKQEALELEKQEQELKKKKAAEAFVNFFVPKQRSEKDQATICSVSNSMLSNFTIKNDMRLAPLFRVNLSDVQKDYLDDSLVKQGESLLYLKSLKNGVSKPMSSGKTWPLCDKDDDDDIMIIEDADLPPIDGAAELLSSESAPCEKLRPKLLAFHENRRPPYWGTWRKKSNSIKPRKPFGQDQKQLDYEVDSDEEWEEEQEGESIDGSAAGSDDEQDGDEYEVDNVVFVPHGYLSDEEATMDEDDVLSLSPETQQARLKHLEDEFESEMKKPTEKLKPRMYGLLWETIDGGKPDNCVDALWNYFRKMSMVMNDPTSLLQPSSEPEEGEKKKVKKKKQAAQTEGEDRSPKGEKKKKSKPEEKESKAPKLENKKASTDIKKNQPGINMFLTKVKSS